MKLIWCTASVIFFPFDYTAGKFMQSNVIWQYCITSPYRILSVLGASVSHINDLYSLPILQKHTKMTDEQTTFFCRVFLLMTHLVGCCGIDWDMRRLKSGANTEGCDILILNSKSYSYLPKIQPQILNLIFNILSNIFNIPLLSFSTLLYNFSYRLDFQVNWKCICCTD